MSCDLISQYLDCNFTLDFGNKILLKYFENAIIFKSVENSLKGIRHL